MRANPKFSETDYFETYALDRRDLPREGALSPERRALLRAYLVARGKLAATGARSVSLPDGTYVSLVGPLSFRRLYEGLETGSDEDLGDMADYISRMEGAVSQARRQVSAEAAERRYERQASEIDASLSFKQRDRKYAGKLVWLYHGTASALLPQIVKEGLQPDAEPAHRDTTPGYVYLTLQPGSYSDGGTAFFYARGAARKFGGEPTVLRVIVPYDDLEDDGDDADLATYSHQYRTRQAVPPGAIMEVGGEVLRERYGK